MKLPNASELIVERDEVSGGFAQSNCQIVRTRGRNFASFDHRLSSGEFMNINEHDCVVLTADLPKEGLKASDVGTVVHIHGNGVGYEWSS